MKKLTKAELDATHRLFTNVNGLVGGYYGHKTKQETAGYASRNRWIMLPVYNIDSLREGTQAPVPNVFIGFDDEIVDDGAGHADCYVGTTYGNNDSMLWLRGILKRSIPTKTFMAMVNALGSEWMVCATHKVHTEYYGSTPKYSPVKCIPADKVTKAKLESAINDADSSKLRKGSFDTDGDLVVSCSTVVSIEAETDEANFDDDIQTAFNLFVKLLTLRLK